MSAKTILICLFTASLLVLGGILWHNATPVAEATAAAPSPPMILVATQRLATGTLLRAQDVKWQTWSDPVTPGMVVRPTTDDGKLNLDADAHILADEYGAVVRDSIDADRPITADAIVKPGDRGFLAAVLSPGYRAITISVTAVSGAAGLIFPGDHVDLILTQTFKQGEEPLARRSVAETIGSDMRVVAIDQQVRQVARDPAEKRGDVARTVTLEALPRQAEMIDVAAELGTLSLILRSVPRQTDDSAATAAGALASAQPVQPIWADDVSPALRPSVKDQPARTVSAPIHIIRGGTIEEWKR